MTYIAYGRHAHAWHTRTYAMHNAETHMIYQMQCLDVVMFKLYAISERVRRNNAIQLACDQDWGVLFHLNVAWNQ